MPRFNLSDFGKRFTEDTGIYRLMVDLSAALNENSGGYFLGGGNPAVLPEVNSLVAEELKKLSDTGRLLDSTVAVYDPAQGNTDFINELCAYLNRHYSLSLKPENIALSNGSQNSFFFLFNLLAGRMSDGSFKKVHFPLLPEYIGYGDLGIEPGLFSGTMPLIEEIDDLFFKYRIDFGNQPAFSDTGLLAVSRPTNPSGNIISDDEIRKLAELAEQHEIPLLIDNAYGLPFPSILFTDTEFITGTNIIHTISLSKTGLPGLRTAAVIADKEIINAFKKMTAVINLAAASLGPAVGAGLLRTDAIKKVCDEVLHPFYFRKSQFAVDTLRKLRDRFSRFRIHCSEGAFFLWLRFIDLPVSGSELYERLKKRGVIIVPGYYSFHGLDEIPAHAHECIRVSFARPDDVIEKGLEIMIDEVAAIYSEYRA